MILILGAGLAGLSCSYHLGHSRCRILEKQSHPYGHIASEIKDGFTWDEGPHVSFTKSEYVRSLFASSVDGRYDEYEVAVCNYFQGHWIDHPAQTSLYQIPEPLRSRCLDSFLASRSASGAAAGSPNNYMEWLEAAFGPVFAQTFPAAYTRKYWTRDARDLTTDWVGARVFYPAVADVVQGSQGTLARSTHYINSVRYPLAGGFQSFAQRLSAGSNVRCGAEVVRVDLRQRSVQLSNGETLSYGKLINTLPLPSFVGMCADVPPDVADAAAALSCSQLLLVNVTAPHEMKRNENWIYVYDEDKLSTRINTTEKLTPGNAPAGQTGVQVEVYSSRHKPLVLEPDDVATRVIGELTEMGLLDAAESADPRRPRAHWRSCAWANVIFDHSTRPALDIVLRWLESFGLQREYDDLDPMTNWPEKEVRHEPAGHLMLAGRFGQWKYFWTDDCVLRGRQLAQSFA